MFHFGISGVQYPPAPPHPRREPAVCSECGHESDPGHEPTAEELEQYKRDYAAWEAALNDEQRKALAFKRSIMDAYYKSLDDKWKNFITSLWTDDEMVWKGTDLRFSTERKP